MKIISFAWTTEALLKDMKTVTRRDWSDAYAKRFKKGEICQAYDKQPRFGGKRVALIRLTCAPYKEPLGAMTDEEEKAEGGLWGSAETFIAAYGKPRDHKVWVIRFEKVSV